ncbi:Virulence sensor protein BvgS [Cyphellophora attinorum]|uniref:histidine kinase n=1 Tax=Cyphellophora attinorum TaxID=1664694 RepID=A0A0N0NL67_9EURO|nr:Virulence sensor protein BvgS [Phialophora attinorum]KPI38828.1 Virulence sensor protein BvgS [Phialophora attinorum]
MSNLEWTIRLPNTSHVQLFKDTDWAATDLGPLSSWGPSLRFAASMVFADSRGACVYWGPRRTAFYNEAFKPMARGTLPRLMGSPFDVVFPELAASINSIFEKATSDGMTVDVDDIPLTVERDGYVEETYFVGQFVPLTDDNGVCGFYNTCHESTFRVLHDRRRLVLDHIMALPSVSVSSVFQHLIGAMETNPNDLTLQGSIGVPDGHKIALVHGDLHQTKSGVFPLLRKAHLKKTPLVISTTDADWGSILEGVQWAGFGEPSRELIISPLASAARLFGFLGTATNPRRKYDVRCEQFVNDITQQLLAKLNSAISIEQARRKEEALLRDLAESERKIRYMADHSPVGMVYFKREGEVVWANQQFYDIIGTTNQEAADVETVLEFYHEDDTEKASSIWEELVQGSDAISGELRLKRPFVTPEGDSEHAWILVHGFSLRGEGEVKYIMACLTDISRIKWAESIQTRNAIAAQEAKRRQEEFIDLISHELRNPLGAITIGAETISNCLSNSEGSQDSSGRLELLNENVHIAETVLVCASHQKRIVDDVLLLSRLESQMLTIAPVLTNLETLVERARRMFSGECKQHDIALKVIRHRSCVDLQAESVICDPSRLMQVIINILPMA